MTHAHLTAVLRVGASVAVLVGLHAALTSVHADSITPAFATQHAQDELANAVAQGKVTLTPTPSPTLTLTPTATATPTVTPLPVEVSVIRFTPTPTDEPCWLLDDQGEVVFDEDGAPVPCPTDQPMEELPTETPTIAPTPVPPLPVQPQPAAPQVITVVQTVEVIVTATPEPATATPPPTEVVIASPTIAMAIATSTPTVTPSATPTMAPAHIAMVNPDRIDRTKAQPIAQPLPDRTAIVLAVLSILVLAGAATAIIWRWRQRVYLKQLAQLP